MQAGAQFNKGTKMLGATISSANISSGKADLTIQGTEIFNHNWDISFTPSIGWFLNKHSVIGASIGINGSRQKYWTESSGVTFSENQTNVLNLGVGGFYRYYFSGAGKLVPFAHAFISGGTGDSRNQGFQNGIDFNMVYENNTDNKFFFHIGANAGVTKVFSDLIGIEASIGYLHSYTKQTVTSTTVTRTSTTISNYTSNSPRKFNSNGVNLSIGLQFYLQKK